MKILPYYYQVHIDDSGTPLNSDAELMLEGALCVGYARALELRKLNGRRRVRGLMFEQSQRTPHAAVR